MNDIWDTLGLAKPTSDIKSVKRAYAARLKLTRPEDDPAGFMALREARDRAIEYCQYAEDDYPSKNLEQQTLYLNTSRPIINVSNKEEGPRTHTRLYSEERLPPTEQFEDLIFDDDGAVPLPAPSTHIVDDTIIAIDKLLKDPFRRQNPDHWLNLLENEDLNSIDNFIEFEDRFLNFLIRSFGHIPKNKKARNRNRYPRIITPPIGKLIFDNMNWPYGRISSDISENLFEQLSHDFNINVRMPTPWDRENGRIMTLFERAENVFQTWLFAIVLLALMGLSMGIGKIFAS